MWSTIIKLITDYYQKKPRKDVIAAVVQLHQCMRTCHTDYRNFTQAKSIDRDHAFAQWISSVDSLGYALARIDSVLSIFSPETRETLMGYHGLEMAAAKSMKETARTLGSDDPGVDFEDAPPSVDFETSMAALNTFIRDTFTIDEIHAATHSVFD